jgi:hypothetical protein
MGLTCSICRGKESIQMPVWKDGQDEDTSDVDKRLISIASEEWTVNMIKIRYNCRYCMIMNVHVPTGMKGQP